MKQVVSWLVVLLGMGLLLVYLLGDLSDSRAQEFRAQAVLVNAQSAARMDYMAAGLPYMVMGLGVLAFAVVAIFLVIGAVVVLGLSMAGQYVRFTIIAVFCVAQLLWRFQAKPRPVSFTNVYQLVENILLMVERKVLYV